MVKRRKGHIINIASLAALGAAPGIATYTATKHAVLGFTDTARLELRGTGVTLSAVLPTLTNTAMIDGVATMSGLRNAEPEDIAAGIVGLIGKPKRRLAVTRAAGLLIDVTHRLMPLARSGSSHPRAASRRHLRRRRRQAGAPGLRGPRAPLLISGAARWRGTRRR